MNLIEKIEIKHFRSFDGGKLQPKVEVIELKDLNIFSGANDSGKSNVLRALNLFFNNEISPGIGFDIKRDLSFIQAERSDSLIKKRRDDGNKYARQTDLWVKIKVHFIRDDGGILPKRFFVEKKWDQNGLSLNRNSNIETGYKKEHDVKSITAKLRNSLEARLTVFLNNIQFEYVPAIKDRNFFNYLFSRLQDYLFERGDGKVNKFMSASEEFNRILTDETTNLFLEFQKSTGVNAVFSIPSTLIDFFTTLSVKTDNNVSLFDRGDGIQARFIPEILNEISQVSAKKIIWGFEEPENSYESKNIRKLRDDMIHNYSQTKQIFLTTHSQEFLSSVGENISIYRVFKTNNSTSQIERYVPEKGFDKQSVKEKFLNGKKIISNNSNLLNEIYKDLGIVDTARAVEDLQNKIDLQNTLISESKLTLEEKEKISQKLKNKIKRALHRLNFVEKEIEEFKKPIIFFEDKYLNLYKVAWLKLHEIRFTKGSIDEKFTVHCPYIFRSKDGKKNLDMFLDSVNISEWDGKKVIGVFDFDDAYDTFEGYRQRWNTAEGNEHTGLFKRRKENKNFFALVLPVPDHRKKYASKTLAGKSLFESELYFKDKVLKSLGNLKRQPIAGGEGVNVFTGSKSKFWQKTLNLPRKDFSAFSSLFQRIENLVV